MNKILCEYINKDIVRYIVQDYMMISKRDVRTNYQFVLMQLECVIGTTNRRTFQFLRFMRLCHYSPFEEVVNLLIS